MAIKLTDQQHKVVHSQERTLLVRAAAGAGKTRVLTERYLKHVLQDRLAPEQILAITFTRKAAAEMKRRIVARLIENGRYLDAQAAETGPIQTIHGFCERVLREHALEAALDPAFEILSESDQGFWLAEARQTVLSHPPDHAGVRALITQIAGKSAFGKSDVEHSYLIELIKNCLDVMRSSGYSRHFWVQRHNDASALLSAWRNALVDSISDQAREYFSPPVGEQSWSEALTSAYTKAGIKKGDFPAWIKAMDDDEPSADLAVGLVLLCGAIWQEFDAILHERQCLDFNELERRTVVLIEENESVRLRLRNQFPIVLIDEAQDLNPVQYRLLAALDPDNSVFVGDAQQSIYGFRQADYSLFHAQAERSAVEDLARNFRSDPGILRFVDRVFGRIWEGQYRPMQPPRTMLDFGEMANDACDGVEIWKIKDGNANSVANGIRELVLEGCLAQDIAVLTRTSSYAQSLHAALNKIEIPSVLVGGTDRFFTRIEVRDVANALRALSNPQDDFAMLAMLHSPIVGLSLDAIVLLAHERPVVTALETWKPTLEADVEPLMRFKSWWPRLSAIGRRAPAYRVLAELFSLSGYWERLVRKSDGEQALANVRKLLRLASEKPEMDAAAFAHRAQAIRQLAYREGDAPTAREDTQAVTIMNIHKAKGLEFPIVVVPQTHKGARAMQDFESDGRNGWLSVKLAPGDRAFHRYLSERRKRDEEAEELRVLYVALTRAEKRLCVAAHPKANARTPSQRLAHALDWTEGEIPGVFVREIGVSAAAEASE